MILGGKEIITCMEMDCGVKGCMERVGWEHDEKGCIVWVPGTGCPKQTLEKPALGPKPYYVVITQRIRELAEAIDTYASSSYNHVRVWAEEIVLLKDVERKLKELQRYNENFMP